MSGLVALLLGVMWGVFVLVIYSVTATGGRYDDDADQGR